MLVSISWTASSAQTLRLESDTVHCYDRNDMRAIALRVIEATECDTVISIMKDEIAFRDSLIGYDQKLLINKTKESEMLKISLEDTEQVVANLEEELKTEVKHHNRTKLKWYVSLALTVIVMTLITK